MTTGTTVNDCPRCGWPTDQVYEVLSRHITSEGVVTYSRCACGEVQVRVQPYDPGEVVGAGGGLAAHGTQRG